MNLSNGTTTPSGRTCAFEYTVKRGDSFYLISKRLGVSLRDLLAANPNFNPARLMVGDVLCIPLAQQGTQPPIQKPVETPPAQTQPEEEVPEEIPEEMPEKPVKMPEKPVEIPPPVVTPPPEETPPPVETPPEETLPEEEVPAFTCPLEERHTVQPGQTAGDFQVANGINRFTLEIANPDVDLENLVAGQVICVPTLNQACPMPTSYILQCDDTLESVAAKFNVTVDALLRVNPCLSPSDFVPCMCVNIPRA